MGGLILFLLVVALLAALIFILINNSIISSKNNVIRSWSDVVTYQRQKTKLLPDLERVTRDYLNFEKQLLSNITELRSALDRVSSSRVDVQTLEDIEAKTQSVFSGFRAVVEAYPDLRSADLIRDLMAEMIELEENIAAAITIFNRNISEFNTGIEIFPNSIVNEMATRLKPYPAFRDSVAEDDIEYKFRG
jgi:LemA protein